MSRTPTYLNLPTPPPWLELSRVPTLKVKRAAGSGLTMRCEVPVTMNFVVANANSKAIPRTKIGAAIYFSTQDLYDFVMKQLSSRQRTYMRAASSIGPTLSAGNSSAPQKDLKGGNTW